MWLLGKIPDALTPIYSSLVTEQLVGGRSLSGVSMAAWSSYWFLRNAVIKGILYRKKVDNFHGLWFVCACVLIYLSNWLRIKQIWGWTAGKWNLTPLSSMPCLRGWFSPLQWELCVLWVWLHTTISFHTGFLLESYAWYNLVLHSHMADVYWDVF